MKVESYNIVKYGPLTPTGKVTLGNFVLIYGPNETGKTLTIEALIKMLFKKNSRKKKLQYEFENINRVSLAPRGNITIKLGEKTEIFQDDKGGFDKFTKLSQTDFRNLFIIRNSDLSFKDDSNYYSGITTKLLGSQIGKIQDLKEEIDIIGHLSPTGKKKEKTKDLLKNVETLNAEINLTIQDFDKEDITDVFVSNFKLQNEIEQIKQEINTQENAEKREKYNSTSQIFIELEGKQKLLKNYSIFTEEEKNEWFSFKNELETNLNYKETKENDINKAKTKKIEIQKQFNDVEFQYDEISKTNIKIIPYLEHLNSIKLDKKYIKSNQMKQNKLNFNLLLIISSILFGISLISSVIVANSTLNLIIYMLGAIFLVIFVIFVYRIVFQQKISFEIEKLRISFTKNGFSSESFEDLLKIISDFHNQYNSRKEKFEKIKNILKISSINLERDQEELKKYQDNILLTENKINLIKNKTHLIDFEEYQIQLKKKGDIENKITENQAKLEGFFSQSDSFIEILDKIQFWKQEIDKLSSFAEKALEIHFDEQKYETLKKKKEDLLVKSNKINEKLNEKRTVLKKIEESAHQIFEDRKSEIICQNLRDLKNLQIELKKFQENLESRIENARIINKILQKLNEEEKEKIEELFDTSGVSKYFEDLTNKRYISVKYNRKQNEIYVIKSNNEILKASQLSAGALDQLYFSIRIGLAEKLLSNEPGFFILDDPFIKADEDRLKELLLFCQGIALKEWQILYFSAKKEIYNLMTEIMPEKLQIIEPTCEL